MRHLIAAVLLGASLALSAQPGDHTLNLKDADIRVFIATVSEITGKSFIVDPRVEGKVNVVSTKPMDAAEVYRTFESVLRVHGYAAVPSGSMVKIVPEAIAKQDGDATAVASGGPDAIVTRVVELKHVAANELLPILQQLVPQSGQVAPVNGANALLITDRAGNLARVEAIIRRVDQASDAAIEVIPLQHASAAELARTLSMLAEEKGAAAVAGVPTKVFADARTNSVLLSGDRAARLRMRTLIGHLDTPLENSDSTNVVYVRYAKAEELVALLEQTAATLTGQAGGENAAKEATIQAHPETNALIITADPAVFRGLASVIRQLDIPRAQVLIEGVIAELSDEYAREIGVQWQSTNLQENADGSLGEGYIGGTNFPGQGGAGGIIGAAANPGSVGSGLNIGYVGGTITLPGSDDPILQIGALVRALGGDGRNNILSSPSVVTLDNQETELSVGQEVPFIQGEFTTNVANASGENAGNGLLGNPFRTIERKEVGLKLTVTPRINEGDSVRMDIKLESSSLAPTPAGASDLITNKRTLSNSVLVPDGNMLVLGGLISNETRENVSKVPGLGDIPVVGNLFRYRSSNTLKRNLMIFLKPTILRDRATEMSVSGDKYNFIRAEQLKARERSDKLSRPQDHAVLPELPEKPAEEGGQ
ncbi:MAG: type II secretion system secretin GspD [Xanthomonadaceae bacterium]|nr:type II secretion system secretin GspD [Xanthomonadaceae bacterium]